MRKIALSALLSSLLLTGVQAKLVEAPSDSKTVSAQAVAKEKKSLKKDPRAQVIKEVAEAVRLTRDAIRAIDQGKSDEAVKALEKGIGKLEVALANPKTPPLVPVRVREVVIPFPGGVKEVRERKAIAMALMRTNAIQKARPVVASMADEIDLLTVNLPLATYPDAMKAALAQINQGKLKEAKEILRGALRTFVEVKIVTPLGILQAQALIKEASKVAKKNRRLAISHLEMAKAALKKSEALGYFSSSDTTYKMLEDRIDELMKEIRGKNRAENLFEEMIEKIKEFKERAVKSSDGA